MTLLWFHDLRMSVPRGIQKMDIQPLLGHKTLQTTRGYINVNTEEHRRGTNLLVGTQELEWEKVGPPHR